MARHTMHYFDLLGIEYSTWARAESRRLPVEATLEAADPILLLISDDAIAEFASGTTFTDKTLIHFSGCVTAEGVTGMHPLSTFGDELYDLPTYRVIPFVCENGGARFEDVFPELPNPHFHIDRTDKPLYHALAVMAGNFTGLLWQKLFLEFEQRLGLSREVALPYLLQVMRTLESDGAGEVTGPLARGDARTVAANLEALAGDPFARVYEAFVQAVAPELMERTR